MLSILRLILVGFSIAVASAWLRVHISNTDSYWLWIAFPLVAYAVIASGMVFLLSRSKTPVHLSPLTLLLSLFPATFIIFNAEVFLRPMYLSGIPLVDSLGFGAANFAFGKGLLSIAGLYTVLTLVFISTGGITLRLSRLSRFIAAADPTSRFITEFTVGLGTWIGILIALYWTSLLNAHSILSTACLILFVERQRFRRIKIWLTKKFEWPPSQKSSVVFLIITLLFLAAFNITESIRPIPTGYDDMTYYMNRVALMTERQSLIEGADNYTFELLATGIGIATGEDTPEQKMLTLSLGTYGLLMGALITFLLGRALIGFHGGLIAAAILLSLPMGPALAILETKPDSLLLPVSVTLIWFLVEAIRSKNLAFFFFACFSFGLAVSTKLTAILFLPGIVFGFLSIIWGYHRPYWLGTIRPALVGFSFFILAMTPWLLHKELSKATAYLRPNTGISLVQDVEKELWGSGQQCPFLGQTEDMLRFDPKSGWDTVEIIEAPWQLTMNRSAGLFATEFGFLFLAILPFGLFVYVRSPRKWFTPTARPSLLIATTITGGIMLWGIYAGHVTWYLYPLFPLLAILSAAVVQQNNDSKMLTWFFTTIILVGITGNTIIRMKFGSSEPQLRYATGAISAEAYAESVFPGYPISMKILNLYPEARIFVLGSRHWYGIKNNDVRAYQDTHLEAFSCFINRSGADGTLDTLQRLGIRYILFPKSLMDEYEGTKRPTFTKKIRQFVEFSRIYLRPIWGSSSHIIYEVPWKKSK